METENDSATTTGDKPAAVFSAAFKSLRERSRTLLRQQADRLRELETRLEQQFVTAVERLESEPREIAPEDQQLFDKVATLERDLRQLQQLRRESEQALDEARTMLAEMEEERRILRDRLDEAAGEPVRDSQAASSSPSERPNPSGQADAEEVERLNRRLEMAMQEVRELKHQNSELAEQSKRPGAAPRAVEVSSNQFSWESQKQRLLEQLTDFDASDPAQVKEKLRCEEVIKTTDRVIAEKDREIAALRQQIDAAIADKTQAAAPAKSAAESILAADDLVKVERARLAEVQAQWQEKLRHAEVEISIERAKIARERLQLEEKLRLLAAQGTAASPAAPSDPKTPKGRWLSRLGLSGESESQ